jgi:hypothetical protein
MRFVAIWVLTTLLAGCSASSRVEGVVPAWANTPPPHPATQHAARRNQPDSRTAVTAAPKPAAEPPETRKPAAAPEQQAKKPDTQNASEE